MNGVGFAFSGFGQRTAAGHLFPEASLCPGDLEYLFEEEKSRHHPFALES